MEKHRVTATVCAKVGVLITAASAGVFAAPQIALAGHSSRAAVTEVPPDRSRDFHYYYFKECIPLDLDSSRVAILRPFDCAANTSNALERIGVTADDVWGLGLDGWSFLNNRRPERGGAGVRAFAADLASADEEIEFVSPVLSDEYGIFIVTPELLVGFSEDVGSDRATAILEEFGSIAFVDADVGGMHNVYCVRSRSRDGIETLEIVNTLAQHPEVVFAEPNAIRMAKPFGVPNDVLFPRQWALHNIGQNPLLDADVMCCSVPCTGDCWPPCPVYCLDGPCTSFPRGLADFDVDAPEAWDITLGDPSVLVVIFDQGIQFDHPDLMIDPALGMDFTGDNGGGFPVEPCDWHGTAVAGIIRGQIDNQIGIAGIAPRISVASARVLQSSTVTAPCGTACFWSPTWIIAGLEWAGQLGARITNHSYGIGSSAALTTMFAHTRANYDLIHFAAAGNCGCAAVSYPANLSSVLAVSALQHTGGLWPQSSRGPEVDFAAPGAFVYSTDPAGDLNIGGFGTSVCNDYFVMLGTSFAAPMAAGIAGLILSVDPELSADRVEQVMRAAAVDLGSSGYDPLFGWGLVNAFNAVRITRNCRANLNHDGVVDLGDLSILLAHFGTPGGPDDGDLNSDGILDLYDLSILLAAFGTTCN